MHALLLGKPVGSTSNQAGNLKIPSMTLSKVVYSISSTVFKCVSIAHTFPVFFYKWEVSVYFSFYFPPAVKLG